MTTLLHLQCSPNGAASTSGGVASAFLASVTASRPDTRVVELDLWHVKLPALDATFVSAQNKILAHADLDDAERAVWDRVSTICAQLIAADSLLVSCPMWNFSVPYRLKHYLDVVIQPGLTFTWSPYTGYAGLLGGRHAQLILTRAGEYTPPAEKAWMDYQTNYLQFILGFLGISDVRTLAVEPTLLQGPDVAASRVDAALGAAREAGLRF